ncbi:toxin-antitoxin system HicB family antitoxin [Isoptericola sp. S6320L]
MSERTCSGEFRVRIPPRTHRRLVELAADDRISLNRQDFDRLASA